jgi:hypothetical protein
LTEIYLCDVCPCQEILRLNGRTRRVAPALEEVVGELLKDGTLLPVELGGLEGGKLAPKASKPQVKTAQGGGARAAAADAVPARKRARKGGGGGGGKVGYVVANRYTLGEAFKVVDARAAAAAAQQATAGGADMEVDEAAAAAAAAVEEEEEQLVSKTPSPRSTDENCPALH